MANMIRVNVHLSEKQIKDLGSLAEATGLKKAELMRRAIDHYLRKQKSDARFSVGDEIKVYHM